MPITRNFDLYLNAGNPAPIIHVSQYDQGETWVFSLYQENGLPYVPSAGSIIGIKADGYIIANDATVSNGKVVVTETEQMTAAAGKAVYELQIDGGTHGTANFIVMVEECPTENGVLSESDISLVESLTDIIPSNTGSVGQVLTKTAGGAQWATGSGIDIDLSVTSSSQNPVTSAGIYDAIEDVLFLPIVNHPTAPTADTDLSFSINPNVLNIVGGSLTAYTSITISSLAGSQTGKMNQYYLRVITGSGTPAITLPNGVSVPTFTVSSGKTYDFIIRNNVASVWENGSAIGTNSGGGGSGTYVEYDDDSLTRGLVSWNSANERESITVYGSITVGGTTYDRIQIYLSAAGKIQMSGYANSAWTTIFSSNVNVQSTVTSGDAKPVNSVAVIAYTQTALGDKADKVAKTTVSGSSVTQALTENTFYVFGEVSNLTITLATPADANAVNEYHFRFTSGSTATTLTLPNDVTMPSGFQVQASKVYEISIIDNYGAFIAW